MNLSCWLGRLSSIGILSALLLCRAALAGPIITVQPGASLDASLNQQSTVDISISGLGSGGAPSVGAFDLDLFFDPALLAVSTVTWGTGLDIFGLGSIRAATLSSGLLNLFELSLDTPSAVDALQPTAFLLASIAFDGLGTGASPLSLSINAVGDANGASLPTSVFYGSVSNTVPEPATFALCLLALALMPVCQNIRNRANRSFSSNP
jgi:hypothetical protein